MHVRVRFADVVGGFFHGNVPAAIVAGGNFGITRLAVERATMEELLDAFALLTAESFEGKRQRLHFAAHLALFRAVFGDDRLEVVVQPTCDHAGANAQGAGHAELGDDRLADEIAFIGKFVEKLGEIFFDFERDDFRLRRFPGHVRPPSVSGCS